ncbi:MAG: hypothetical protein R3Y32_08605 [Bacillota bacterium]
MKKSIKIIMCVVIIIALVFGVWWVTPKTFPKVDSQDVAEIQLFNGNTGETVVIDDRETIDYIISEMQSTSYHTKGLALGMGTSFHVNMYDAYGTFLGDVVVQSEQTLKVGNWFYEASTAGAIVDLHAFLEEINGFAYKSSLENNS